VTQIEVRVGVTDLHAFERFYTQACGAQPIGGNRYKVGDTIFAVFHDPSTKRVSAPPFASPLEVIKAMTALGIHYVTVQVCNCDEAFEALTSGGALEVEASTNLGPVARICFVRDPDGTFEEISQCPPS